jgi:hypothetical protein
VSSSTPAGEGLPLAGTPRPGRWGFLVDVVEGGVAHVVHLDADATDYCSCGQARCRHIRAALRQGGAAC